MSHSLPNRAKEESKQQQSNLIDITFTYNYELLYDALVQSTNDYIFIGNLKTDTYRFPKPMVDEFALPGEVIQDMTEIFVQKVHKHDKQALLKFSQNIKSGNKSVHCIECRVQNRFGNYIWLNCRGSVKRDESGEPVLFAGIISLLGKKNKIDPITGLHSKFVFEEEIKKRINSNPNEKLGIMILGLDDFKHINNLYNRTFGDEVIRVISQKILSLLPEDANVFRLDGDEFGILVPNGSRDKLKEIYESIYTAFLHQQELDGKKYYCTLSAGCCVYTDDGQTYLDLLKYGGYSLDCAKINGKNKLSFFSKEILTHTERLLDLTELLRESVENNFAGFELFFQMQVNAKTRKLTGTEALARWHCEKYGSISPNEFIPILEQSGLIIPVGKWIFKQAIQACAQWMIKFKDFTMSINLSCLQLAEPDFVEFMKKTMAEANVDPKHIIVELTESYIASSIGSLNHIFAEIRNLGVKIAMDDFGTGYSSLGILKKSPTDIVKIDRSFVIDLKENSSFDATLIRFIVELCHDLNIQVCLEGIETEDEYQIVSRLKLDFIQGYLFGRPVSGQEFDQIDFEIAN